MQSTATQHRRATDHPRRPHVTRSLPRDRFTIDFAGPSEHRKGWVQFAMALPLPANASVEFAEGYAEARACAIDIYSAEAALAVLA